MSKIDKLKQMTEEERKKYLKECVDYVFRNFEKSKPQERRIVAYSYCKGINGARDYGTNMKGLCGHPECDNCRRFGELLLPKGK